LNYYTLGGHGVNLFYGEWGRMMGCYDYCNEHLGLRKERDICSGAKPLPDSEE